MTPKQIEKALDKLTELYDEAEATAAEYRGAAEELAAEIQAYYDDQSGPWQEGGRRQAYPELIGELEGIEAAPDEPPGFSL
jgi:hypothetical protein